MDLTKFPSRSSGENVLKYFAFIVLLIAGAFLIVFFITVQTELNAPLDNFAGTIVTLEKGENASSLIRKLKEHGIVRHPMIVKLYLKLTQKDKKLKPATVSIEPSDTLINLVNKIILYKEKPIKVVIYEGMDSFEIADTLESLGITNSTAFLKGVFRRNSLEGYLFPDTYYFIKGTEASEIINTMIANFYRKAAPVLKKSKILSPYKTLIVASLVQKETYVKEEMPLVASVIYNRLRSGMPLQIDPTVIYAYKLKSMKNLKFVPKPRHLKIESPYNTYKIKGLPPTPICNPGLDAIKAAVFPAKTNYLYFVAKGDGTHYFSKTLAEHQRAIRKYLIGRHR
ncbi:conserved hypothetical protein [Thermosulfidibacter takaii ABI70S6]|uniref:Endolytic murein transglycosylase n=1 Tax=Thermosulfidibacter takaii (strain DSM 17441 / JCM 13301 / NBRC 103674 / ABI70S6) TaxID=1298851 RepID=A0A0S3QUN7_THET7|nr:endolytic transglycosylase MltG [Thermosulfidibacter takaii]BAT72028.1 conserved hypothetical protein [Thermosulfidibacter takaii ABI70S6]